MSFEVAREGGNEYVRNKVLRKVLTSEQQLIAKGLPLSAPLDARNYRFKDGGTTDGLQRVVLTAARHSDGIVNGSLLLSPESGDVTQIAGRLVKSPSFWVTDVDVVWTYARVGGQVLPVEMTSSQTSLETRVWVPQSSDRRRAIPASGEMLRIGTFGRLRAARSAVVPLAVKATMAVASTWSAMSAAAAATA